MESDAVQAGQTRCGYVALIGRPNVGKSTLLNRFVGQKLSIVTAKPQTTRQQIAGIKTTAEGQVVFLDTPGIHLAAKRALNRYMNLIARAALNGVDVVLFLIEAERWTKQDEHVARALENVAVPIILVVNKVDQVADKTHLLAFLRDKVQNKPFAHVVLISARQGKGVADLEALVMQHLPFSKPMYDEDQFTDRSERFLAGELIREQLMLRLNQELPYALTVEVEEFKRTPELLRISAIIWVEREGQKQIVIGSSGQVLKQVGSRARAALEELFEQKVFLRTWVKVSSDWSDNEKSMRQLGFDEFRG
jgi:GTP-binding protein Era